MIPNCRSTPIKNSKMETIDAFLVELKTALIMNANEHTSKVNPNHTVMTRIMSLFM